ncbi:hypothetical protein D3C87_1901820 [compost metagenome]
MKTIEPTLSPKQIEFLLSKYSNVYRGYWDNELINITSVDFQKVLNALLDNKGGSL